MISDKDLELAHDCLDLSTCEMLIDWGKKGHDKSVTAVMDSKNVISAHPNRVFTNDLCEQIRIKHKFAKVVAESDAFAAKVASEAAKKELERTKYTMKA